MTEEMKRELEEEKLKEKYVKAKAEAETREIANIVQDTNKAIKAKLNEKVVNKIENSAEIEEKIDETTTTLVDMGLQTQKNDVEADLRRSEKEKAKAEFELDEDQYRAFGQETAPKEEWKKKMIKYLHNFWFCVICVICFFSLAPFYIFVKVIKTQKGILRFVAIAVGVLLLLTCLAGFTYGVLNWTGVIK